MSISTKILLLVGFVLLATITGYATGHLAHADGTPCPPRYVPVPSASAAHPHCCSPSLPPSSCSDHEQGAAPPDRAARLRRHHMLIQDVTRWQAFGGPGMEQAGTADGNGLATFTLGGATLGGAYAALANPYLTAYHMCFPRLAAAAPASVARSAVPPDRNSQGVGHIPRAMSHLGCARGRAARHREDRSANSPNTDPNRRVHSYLLITADPRPPSTRVPPHTRSPSL